MHVEEGKEKAERDKKRELDEEGTKTKILVKVGKPFVEIINTAKKEKVSLIVRGSHGRIMVEEMFLGSTAENVIRHSTMPVMIIR